MNNTLAKCIDAYCPKISKVVAEGTIKDLFRGSLEYLDEIFRSSMRELNSNINLTYWGYEEMTPEQVYEFYFVENKNNAFDIAHSDIYGVYFVFQLNGEYIKRPMFMPYCHDGNIMSLSGTKYIVSPVLSDTVISPKQSEIFVRLLKKKVRFIKNNRNICVNSRVERQPFITVNMFSSKTNVGALGDVECPTSIYLLAKFGFYGTINIYAGKKASTDLGRGVTFGVGGDIWMTNQEITEEDRARYNIFESELKNNNELPPKVKNLFPDQVLEPHKVKILVNKDIEITSFLKYFISGVIYIFDAYRYNSVMMMELVNGTEEMVDKEIANWRIILGKFISKGNHTIAKLTIDVEENMRHLDSCLDTLIEKKLRDVGVYVASFYDLLAYILANYTQLTMSESDYNADIRNKYIDVMYYIFFDHIVSINKTIKSLNKKLLKATLENNVSTISAYEVTESFKDEFKYYRIFNLLKGGLKSIRSLCLKACDYTGDIKYAKCTVILEDQSRGEGVKTPKIQRFPDVCKNINPVDLLFGSIFNLNKEVPTGRLKINLFCNYDPVSGQILISEKESENIASVERLLKLVAQDDSNTIHEEYENNEMYDDSEDFEDSIG